MSTITFDFVDPRNKIIMNFSNDYGTSFQLQMAVNIAFQGTSLSLNMQSNSASALLPVVVDGVTNSVAIPNNSSFADIVLATGLTDGWHELSFNIQGVAGGSMFITKTASLKVTGATPAIRAPNGFDLFVLGLSSTFQQYALAPGWGGSSYGCIYRLYSTSSIIMTGRMSSIRVFTIGANQPISVYVDGVLAGTQTVAANVWGYATFTGLDASKDHTYEVVYVYRGTSGLGCLLYALAAGGPTTNSIVLYPPPPSKPTIVGIGDSLTDTNECNSSMTTNGWFWRFSRQLGVQPHNIAIGGSSLDSNGAVVPAVVAPVSPPPALITIQWGTNDRNTGYTASQFGAAYSTLIAALVADCPNSVILCMAIFQYADSDTYNQAIQTAVASAANPNVIYQSTYGWFTSADTCDGTHPTYAGHTKILNKMLAVLPAAVTRQLTAQAAATDVVNNNAGLFAN
jgi:lysophospholipase L1-like esterase